MPRKPLNVIEHLLSPPDEEVKKNKKSLGLKPMIPIDEVAPDFSNNSNTKSNIKDKITETTKITNTTNTSKKKAKESTEPSIKVEPIDESTPVQLMQKLFEKAPDTTTTSHYVSVSSEKFLKEFDKKFNPDRKSMPLSPLWNLAMLVFEQVLVRLPENWEEEIGNYKGSQEIFHLKFIEIIMRYLRDGK